MNRKPLSLEEIKKRELAILEDVDAFCREQGLTYFINFGTLIGAVRHKGFIPWDDDIDLMMPRADYERFISLYSEANRPYQVLEHRKTPGYYNHFMKVIDPQTELRDLRNHKTYPSGVFIDIFPCDTFDDWGLVEKMYQLESVKLLCISPFRKVWVGDHLLKDIARTWSWLVLGVVKPTVFTKIIQRLIDEIPSNASRYQGSLAEKFKEKGIVPAGSFDELIDLPFEHLIVKAPKQYDMLLRHYYGDYMQLPPVEQQVNPHDIVVYLKD